MTRLLIEGGLILMGFLAGRVWQFRRDANKVMNQGGRR